MIKKLVLPLLILGFASSSFGAIRHEINTTEVLRCSFSRQHQNRVLLEGGSIRKVFCPSSVFSIQMEGVSGQAFLYALRDFVDPVTVTVVTDSGMVQDIEITLEDKSSEVVILKEMTKAPASSKSSDREDLILSVVDCARRGNPPPGFVAREIPEDDERKIKRPLRAHLREVYEGPFEWIETYCIHNSSRVSVSLCEADLIEKGVNWVFIEERELCPNSQTIALISRQKPEPSGGSRV